MPHVVQYIVIFSLSFLFFSGTENKDNTTASKAERPIPSAEKYSEEIDYTLEQLIAAEPEKQKSGKRLAVLKDSPNYFRIDHSGETLWNGKFWPAHRYPLNIYIEKSFSPHYKKRFSKYVDYSLELWEEADHRIKFSYVNYPDAADVIIVFEENLMEKYNQNYMGLTEYELDDNKRIRLSLVQISLLNYDGKPIRDGEIKATIIHELGHALGLGHSENSIDIMFPFIDPASNREMKFEELSNGDINAVRSAVDLGEGRIFSELARPSY